MTAGLRYIEEHTARWRGVAVRIRWEPQFLNNGARMQPGHLQIESTDLHRAPLPIIASGYLSWFTSSALVQDSGRPIAFVLQWLDTEASGGRERKPKPTGGSSACSGERQTQKRGQPPSWPLRRLCDTAPYSAAVISAV